jgi:hypothetical protein
VIDFEEIRSVVEAELDLSWVAHHGEWSWAAAMALIGERPPHDAPPT